MKVTMTLATVELELMVMAAKKKLGAMSQSEIFDKAIELNVEHWLALKDYYATEKTEVQKEICSSIHALEKELGVYVTCPF